MLYTAGCEYTPSDLSSRVFFFSSSSSVGVSLNRKEQEPLVFLSLSLVKQFSAETITAVDWKPSFTHTHTRGGGASCTIMVSTQALITTAYYFTPSERAKREMRELLPFRLSSSAGMTNYREMWLCIRRKLIAHFSKSFVRGVAFILRPYSILFRSRQVRHHLLRRLLIVNEKFEGVGLHWLS